MTPTPTLASHTRIAIVGSGFAGLGLAIRLRQQGRRDFVVFEKADDVGGTWRDNTYPGCQCDVPSRLYSFSFAPKPDWSRTYPLQEEIQQYLRDCALRFGVLPFIRLGHTVGEARWNDDDGLWHIATSQGAWTAEFLVGGHGGLSAPATPGIAGVEDFGGEIFHSAQWNAAHDVAGERVAVLGTGASAIQIVPSIQPEVAHLTVFQRTAPWVLPHTDRAVSRWEQALYRRLPFTQTVMRNVVYWSRELIFLGMRRPSWLTRRIQQLGLQHLQRQVPDPELRAKVTPRFQPGCKRLLLSNRYYPALMRDNVTLVTDPVVRVTSGGIETADGTHHALDTIVLATGFRVTDHPVLEVIYGRDGRSMAKTFADTGMRAYRGTTVAGFPNLFLLSGPNTGIGHTSLVVMIEAQIDYVLDCLRTMDRRGLATVDVRRAAVDEYNEEIARRTEPTVWASGCASWYLDEQGRNTTLWPDFTWKFRRLTRRFDLAAYETTPRRADDAEAAA